MKLLRIANRVTLTLCLLSLSACGSKQANNPGAQDTGTKTNAPGKTDPKKDATNTGNGGGGNNNAKKAELGEECKADADCKSNICLTVEYSKQQADSTGAAGTGTAPAEEVKNCAACRDDAQCIAEKKGLACKLSLENAVIECIDGSLGSPCSKKEHCSGNLSCALINMGDNKSEERTCSECEKHTDCPAEGKRNCVSRDTEEKPGYFNLCLEDGVRKTGEVCFPCETGNRECAEGHCVKVKLEDGIDDNFCIGVCGACTTDADCPADSRCTPPQLNFEGKGLTPHTASKCVKK